METRNSSTTGRRSSGSSQNLEQEVSDLLTLDIVGLRGKWSALFVADPPSRLGRTLLIGAIAYRLQEKALGGLKPSAQRALDRVCDQPGDSGPTRIAKTKVNAGTVLIREWRGVRHRVTVLDHDVVYRGRRYRSLSEVARAITGTHWSGPVFFGLRQRAQKAAAHG
jgi:hypothetical protein